MKRSRVFGKKHRLTLSYFHFLYTNVPHKSLESTHDLSPTVPACNYRTKCVDSPGIIHDRMHDCHTVFWAWMRPHIPDLTIERSFYSQAMPVNYLLGVYFDMLSMGVCTTRHWQTSGRLVQELTVFTVWKYLEVL